MKSSEIRRTFIEYFRQRDHEVVRSSPLIPRDDPTLLFTNAGMVQFKRVFLGEEQRPYKRAVSCQKCMRVGGKHSDLENVGHTARHHTFFEMLGNFSFGDYFKAEAIGFAWQLLTEWFKLPKERLWVSVYEEDDEADRLWRDLTDVDPSRIVRLGPEDNFWQMGDTGPCGPCSEIIIDQGEEVGCGRQDCSVGCDCDRYLELWNLVFMQYNRDEQGNLTPLPRPSIDTGMGLERITAVLQGKTNNFDTDLFGPIIGEIERLGGVTYGSDPRTDISVRVIADHIRAITFLLAEGLIPTNEGRGYVLRRVIRRAARHARLLGMELPVLYRIVPAVVEVMGEVYPEVVDERERTEKLLRIEEERFERTLQVGLNILDGLIDELKREGGRQIPGDELFRLYDTYGFPIDLARDIANDEGLELDEEGFQRRLQEQRQKTKTSVADLSVSFSLEAEGWTAPPTEFVGYEKLEDEAEVIEVLGPDGRRRDELTEGQEGLLVLDRTPFYGAAGGQVADTGWIRSEEGYAEVIDTTRHPGGVFLHRVRMKRGVVRRGERVRAMVDKERRHDIMRNHTATHLLHRALRTVLGEHVRQAGSLVAPDRLRFDFTHYQPVSREELQEVEALVNEKIMEDLEVSTEVMSLDEALRTGAVALFEEKYEEEVRVVSAGDFSRELCGGTHCRRTGEIGLFLILSEGSVASGIRRIEAVTGKEAYRHVVSLRQEHLQLKEILKAEDVPERVRRVIEELKRLQKEVEHLRAGSGRDELAEVVKRAKEVRGVKVVALKRDGLNQRELRLLADNIRDRLGSGIIFVASEMDSQASFVCMVTKDLTDRYNAGQILKRLAEQVGGRGGGKPDMAQGGTKDPKRLKELIERIEEYLSEALSA